MTPKERFSAFSTAVINFQRARAGSPESHAAAHEMIRLEGSCREAGFNLDAMLTRDALKTLKGAHTRVAIDLLIADANLVVAAKTPALAA